MAGRRGGAQGVEAACLRAVAPVALPRPQPTVDLRPLESIRPRPPTAHLSLYREKKGYSGVTTYASEAWAPLSAEADCLQAAEGEEEEEKADLNREGR